MELKKIISLAPGSLEDEEKDELCKTLCQLELDDKSSSDSGALSRLFEITQALLKNKVEQIDSLVLELDEVAAKQGEEEAQHAQEVEDLKAQLAFASKHGRQQFPTGDSTEDELRELLRNSEMQAEKLISELEAHEQEQMADKAELERLAGQIAALESERSQLKREVLALREEVQDHHKDVESPKEDLKKKHQQLVDSLRQKNKHISQLLNDIESTEKENTILREKLTNIKSELAEATQNIKLTTGEIANLHVTKEEQLERINHLEQLCEALHNQVQELVNEKERRDADLESFEKAIDERVQEWKGMVEKKEEELKTLQGKLSEITLQGHTVLHESDTDRVALLSQTLQKRECQIEDLQTQLTQATKDLNESTAFIEKLQLSSKRYPSNSEQKDVQSQSQSLYRQILQAEERIKLLEEKVQDAEKDAEGKSEDITQLIIQLRRYESGEFGLAEAVAKIKELTTQQRVRDKHIGELIDTVNMLRCTSDALEEQNALLRERLDLPPNEELEVDGPSRKKEQKNLAQVQQQQIDRLEEELVELRMDRRKLSQQVLMLCKQAQSLEPADQPQQLASQKASVVRSQIRAQADIRSTTRKIRKLQHQQHRWEIERQSLIEENEALRQGLHEILDSVHSQDGLSKVELESKGLENLLQALDSRHVSGWYHPAMRLQAQVNTVEGNNAALREQLRKSREGESKTVKELQEAKSRILELEKGFKNVPVEETDGRHFSSVVEMQPTSLAEEVTLTLSLPSDFPASGLDIVNRLNNHLLQVLNKYQVEKELVTQLQTIQDELRHEVDVLVGQLMRLSQEQVQTKEDWEQDRVKLQEESDTLHSQLAASEAQLTELRSAWSSFSTSDEAGRNTFYRSAEEVALLSADKAAAERKASAAMRQAEQARHNLQLVKAQWNSVKSKVTQRLEELLVFKKKAILQVTALEKKLSGSVPVECLEAANRRAQEMTSKYTQLLRQQEMITRRMDSDMKRTILELESEKETSLALSKSLQEASKRLIPLGLQGCSSESEMVSELTLKLAAAEARELTQSQRASHAEKMCALTKAELMQIESRCSQLEQEISSLLSQNHELQLRENSLQDKCLNAMSAQQRDELEAELAFAKSQVVELKTNHEQLQEFSDIAQEQVLTLDQLYEGCETQLDSLRQTVFQLQSSSDQTSTIARLNEDLCASRLSEMVAVNRVNSLQSELRRLLGLIGEEKNKTEDMKREFSRQQEGTATQLRATLEALAELRARCAGFLPTPFFHLFMDLFIRRSSECKDTWRQLQEARAELSRHVSSAQEKTVICQQSLELQNALQATHSDAVCQRTLESWASTLTELKLKESKSRRRAEALEAQVKQMEERILKEEELTSSLEQQLLSFNIQTRPIPASTGQENVCHVPLIGQGDADIYFAEKESLRLGEHLVPGYTGYTDVPYGKQEPLRLLSERRSSARTQVILKDVQLQTETQSFVLEKETMQSQELDRVRSELQDLKIQTASLNDKVKLLSEELARKEEELHTCKKLNKELELRESNFSREKDLLHRCEELESRLPVGDALRSSDREKELLRKCEELESRLSAWDKQGESDKEKELLRRCGELEGRLGVEAAVSDKLGRSNKEKKPAEEELTRKEYTVELAPHKKVALKATVDSLQNIINQKEETICRYQSLLRDIREEDNHIISALQEQLRCQQADLSAQHQAYNRLKSTVRQQSVDSNGGAASASRSALEVQLARTNELEDEVALLSTKVATLTTELKVARQEAQRWSSTAQQRLMALEDISHRLEGQSYDETIPSTTAQERSPNRPLTDPGISIGRNTESTVKQGKAERAASEQDTSKSGVSTNRSLQVQMQLRSEIQDLRQKLQKLEEQDRLSRKEIQRLRDQIPIYSRRTRRDPLESEKVAELLKTIDDLQEQLQELKKQTEKADIQRTQQEIKKIKSAENVARWDERKKYLNQIEKLKVNLQEQEDEVTLAHAKMDRMHSTIHRLEREKIVLEHQVKLSKGNLVTQCMVDELQSERDKLQVEVREIRSKLFTEKHQKCDHNVEKLERENASLLKANVAFECENLELKLELEKIHADTPRLQHKVMHLEQMVEELHHSNSPRRALTQGNKEAFHELSQTREENCKLRDHCDNLKWQLEQANLRIGNLESNFDGRADSTLQVELRHKTQLLSKVKVLLERAAIKEKALTDQINKLQEYIRSKPE